MAIVEVKVPVLPESVADATIATWHKKPGDAVKRDENLVDLETDKVVLESAGAGRRRAQGNQVRRRRDR
jgi:pyruvate/2-oxoglutarate dehydrogenase complex dihydrolipoamide acyltransferase (E2) component